MDRESVIRSRQLADAVPFYGEGDPIPDHRDLSSKDDTSRFRAVLQILIRGWPFIEPQILGRWWQPGRGTEERIAELLGGRGFTFSYMPFLVTLLVMGVPSFGLIDVKWEYPINLLYSLVAVIVISAWVVTFVSGKIQAVSFLSLLLAILVANMIAFVLIEEAGYNLYTGAITIACISGWFVQVGLSAGSIKFRFRIDTHLIYYAGLQLIQGLGFLLVTLVVAEIVNQSLLQNEPLMPGLSTMIGYPEMSRDVSENLTESQRMELRWAPLRLELLWFLILLPLQVIMLYYVVWIFQRINHDLRMELVDRWHRLSLRHHMDHRVGDSIWRIQSDSETITFVLKALMELLLLLVNAMVAIGFISILSPALSFLMLTVLIPSLVLARWAMPRYRTRSLVERRANADLTSRVQESFKSIKLSKAYQAGSRYQDQFEEDSMIAFNAGYRHTRLGLRVGVVIETYSELFIFGGFFLMAYWVNSGKATYAAELIALAGMTFVVWNLSAFRWASERYEESIGSLGEVIKTWGWVQDIAMGLRRVFDILDMQPEVSDRPNAVPFRGFSEEISFKDIVFAYTPGRPVLQSASMRVVPGSITAIVGPSGAGKSTLMSLLLRLFDPDSGSITIDGMDLREFRIDSLRKSIAIALQEDVLFGMTIRQNICYAQPDATKEQIEEALRVACLSTTIEELPEGLDTMLGDRGGRLSAGQRQRLSLARAIVRQSPILILDEPTASLDAETESIVMANIDAWTRASDRSVFLITHRISTISRADNILYMDSGKILESGTYDQLMEAKGRFLSFAQAESTAKGDDDV